MGKSVQLVRRHEDIHKSLSCWAVGGQPLINAVGPGPRSLKQNLVIVLPQPMIASAGPRLKSCAVKDADPPSRGVQDALAFQNLNDASEIASAYSKQAGKLFVREADVLHAGMLSYLRHPLRRALLE